MLLFITLHIKAFSPLLPLYYKGHKTFFSTISDQKEKKNRWAKVKVRLQERGILNPNNVRGPIASEVNAQTTLLFGRPPPFYYL